MQVHKIGQILLPTHAHSFVACGRTWVPHAPALWYKFYVFWDGPHTHTQKKNTSKTSTTNTTRHTKTYQNNKPTNWQQKHYNEHFFTAHFKQMAHGQVSGLSSFVTFSDSFPRFGGSKAVCWRWSRGSIKRKLRMATRVKIGPKKSTWEWKHGEVERTRVELTASVGV